MPDFDTRGPNEPEQPSTLHRFGWVRTIFRSRWDIGLALLNLVLGFAILMAAIDRFVESPTERLGQRLDKTIEYQSTPEYFEQRGAALDNPAYACKPRVDACPWIHTKATGAKKLAYLTEEVGSGWIGGTDVVSVHFYDGSFDPPINTNATSYCFYDKDDAVAALRGSLNDA